MVVADHLNLPPFLHYLQVFNAEEEFQDDIRNNPNFQGLQRSGKKGRSIARENA